MENKTFYDILGVTPKCSTDDIRKAYHKLIAHVHPDKNRSDKHGSDKHDSDVQARTLNKAYAILKNPASRKEYDNSLKVVKKSKDSFMSMKQSAKEFLDSQKMTQAEFETAKKKAEDEFNKLTLEHNRKMGYDKSSSIKPNIDETDQKLSQLETLRDQEYIENIPDKLFAYGEEFNPEKFNQLFDQAVGDSNGLIEYTGETVPYNEIEGAGIDETDDDIVNNDNDEKSHFIEPLVSNQFDTLIKKSHKYCGPQKSIEELMKEREEETKELHSMKMYEYNTNVCINASGASSKTDENWLNNK